MTSINNRLKLALLAQKRPQNILSKGFTLVELMVVIVIVGILSSIALPNFLSQQNKAKMTESTAKMSAILKAAHAEYQFGGGDSDAWLVHDGSRYLSQKPADRLTRTLRPGLGKVFRWVR